MKPPMRLFEAKPFIIAEVGSNWLTEEDCQRSIAVAKECGADAVKFQAFTGHALYGMEPPGGWNFSYELQLQWLPLLKAQADACGIEFMCTAFSPELVAAVDPFVSVHKVASSDAAWPQMLEAVRATGKPVLVSLGAKSAADIKNIVPYLSEARDCPYAVFMECVASYPADFVDLERIGSHTGYMEIGEPCGFSDHSLGYTAAVQAARQGVDVIEKHFTAFPDLDTPDRPHSLTPAQFKRMVDIIRGRPVESEEQAMYLRHNRRLIATMGILEDEPLRYGQNYGAYRSLECDTRGLSPFEWERVEGKRATRPIKRGQAIGEGDFG